MLEEGSYVCLLEAPNTRKGTLHQQANHEGIVQFVFRQDPRFGDRLPDVFINEAEVQECQRPSETEVAKINALLP